MNTVLRDDPRMIELVRRMEARPVPEAGIHRGLSFDDYLRWNAASNSELAELAKSPAHLRHYREQLRERTDDEVVGSALHCLVLEPDVFRTRYVCGPIGDGRTKKVQEATANLRAEYPAALILRPWQWRLVMAMRDSIHAHPAACWVLDQSPERELSFAWTDRDSGVRCKGRTDALGEDLIVDVKTTRNASPEAFRRALFWYGYDRQAAFYRDGLNVLAGEPWTDEHPGRYRFFVFIAIEKEPPHPTAVYRVNDEAMVRARAAIRPLLRLYADCMEQQRFPGYGDEIMDIGAVESPYTFSMEIE